MKKVIKSMKVLITAFILIVSCIGCGSRNIKLPDAPTDLKYEAVTLIDGPLSEYIEVVPGSYLFEIEKNENSSYPRYDEKIKVKFRFIKPIEVKAGQGYNSYGPSLIGKVLDEQGAPLDFSLYLRVDKDLATYLKRGSGEEWFTLRVSGQGSISTEEDALKLIGEYKKGKKIRFNSEIIEEKFDSQSSTSNSPESESITGSSSSNNCDEFLEQYKKFVNDYIYILKKYKNDPTDVTVLSEYTTMASEVSEWNAKISDCTADENFANKFSEIQMKIANAASGL
jgi:hypothetical protein